MAQICTKSFVGWGFAPDPTGGAYSAPPDPPAGLRVLLLRREVGRDGRGGENGRKGKVVPPPNAARGSGERCISSPSGVWGGAPAEIEFGAF